MTAASRSIVLPGRAVVRGVAEGSALVSTETIAGWGALDPVTGTITERRHPLVGQSFAGRVLVFPGAKGSSGWAAMFQTCRFNGTAPLAMVFTTLTTKVALGAVVTRVPAMTDLSEDPITVINTGDRVRVDADRGLVEITPS
jgi:predicted aconitase with swiveling domain